MARLIHSSHGSSDMRSSPQIRRNIEFCVFQSWAFSSARGDQACAPYNTLLPTVASNSRRRFLREIFLFKSSGLSAQNFRHPTAILCAHFLSRRVDQQLYPVPQVCGGFCLSADLLLEVDCGLSEAIPLGTVLPRSTVLSLILVLPLGTVHSTSMLHLSADLF